MQLVVIKMHASTSQTQQQHSSAARTLRTISTVILTISEEKRVLESAYPAALASIESHKHEVAVRDVCPVRDTSICRLFGVTHPHMIMVTLAD